MLFLGFNFFPGLLGLLLFPLSILAAWWTFKDASQRNLSPLLWAGVSFSIFPIGFLFYLGYIAVAGRNRI